VETEPLLDLSSKEEAKVDSPYFTESGMISLLAKAILLFKRVLNVTTCV
jgi:hypothetical protein